ncbi:MAG: hypothetical protein COT31_03020 [Candidatus Moranbacteria bacterium CG08_land_8_20_14_0_20_34_16]|nr:MAG: hypothetical protein COT31_03020 [Candidatus Moranbacteria bacterium CG08_land_8_20_14_0_20_34_16]
MKKHIGLHYISGIKNFFIFVLIMGLGLGGMFFSVRVYSDFFQTSIFFSKSNEIVRPADSLEINFSLPIETFGYAEKIEIIPQQEIKWKWENSNKKLKIFPKKNWQPETNYKIILPAGKNIMFCDTPSEEWSFSTEKYPQILKIIPQNNATDVIFGAEDPIMIDFANTTQNFSLKFTLNSKSDLFIQDNSFKTQFKILPKEEILEGEKYHLEIYAKYLYSPEKEYKKIFESYFETEKIEPIVWEKDYTLRIAQTKKYTRAKIKEGKYIDINLETQILSFFENGKILDAYLISSGKRGMDTPQGETEIFNKTPRAYSKAYGLYMPNWMALKSDGKFGIHELPEWSGGYKEGEAHLGTPVSHGCVRLGVGSAKTLYDWAEIGTPVIIY